jgi:hypothetical protein
VQPEDILSESKSTDFMKISENVINHAIQACGVKDQSEKNNELMTKCIKMYFSDKKKKTIKTDDIDENVHQFIAFYENFVVMKKLDQIEIEESKYDFVALRNQLKELNKNRNLIIDPDHSSLSNL